jgi:signal peptidase I
MEIAVFSLIAILVIVVPRISLYFLYQKAGEAGWKALIPVMAELTHLKITGRPWWWIFYLLIPMVNIFVALSMYLDLMKSFGKDSFLDQLGGILLWFVFLPLWAFSPSVAYVGKTTELPVYPKGTVREWADAILFAVVAAVIIRWLFMEAFTIPTPSMERSMLVGDFLFVSKFHYGTRTPKTPIQVPLTHQKIWGTEIPSYTTLVQLPHYRLPGFTEVKRNDVVVFNYPPEFEYPIDLKTNYIKRCVGLPGDVLEIDSRQVIINGEALENPELMQFSYRLQTSSGLSERVIDTYNLSDFSVIGATQQGYFYRVHTSPATAEVLSGLPFVIKIELEHADYTSEMVESNIFPDASQYPWNGDFYGPITIPQAGMTIEINAKTLAMYRSVIEHFEYHKEVKIEEGKLWIQGEEVSSYTFIQNYYFMMGDNRHNSLDSRYFGFVPEDHIVGKAFFIWLSLDKTKGFPSNIRWSRIFNMVR